MLLDTTIYVILTQRLLAQTIQYSFFNIILVQTRHRTHMITKDYHKFHKIGGGQVYDVSM